MNTHPVGLSGDLAPRQVTRAKIGQYDIAVWRSASGVVSAWDNRCPHRGMRLSHGFVRGESLACAYHGWHYNCEGYCHYIPAHPELTPPKTVRPVAYSVVEQGGLIWINPTHQATPIELPDDCMPIRSLSFACNETTATIAMTETPWCDGDKCPVIRKLSDTPQVLALSMAGLDEQFYVAFHQTCAHKVILHALSRGTASTNARTAISRWLESVRRIAEVTERTS